MGRESYLVAAPPDNSPPRSSPAPAPTALAPGFRFHPTDEELVIYYLKRKVIGKSFRFNAITEVDVYKCEPWDLSDKSSLKSRDQEFYFFSALDRKYGNGARMNRATCQGYWKATGNDRPVKHNSRTVGLKKTLVFHSGRAPDGKRTNWVMHEYRIVDEELEKAGVGAAQDAFVLCRIFHKSNIGPPSGQRYAPFIEEEWDDDDYSMVIPGMDNREDNRVAPRALTAGVDSRAAFSVGNTQRPCVERIAAHVKVNEENVIVQEDTQGTKRLAFNPPELSEEDQSTISECKVEKPDDYRLPCVINRKDKLEADPAKCTKQTLTLPVNGDRASSPLLMYKRRRHNDANSSNCNASNNSSRATQDHSSSATTAATATTATAAALSTVTTATTTAAAKPPTTRNFLSSLVEYSLLETVQTKDNPPELDAGNLDSALPASCVKFIQDLQSEIHQVSIERDTLKFEMMSAQAMINILQSRIDILTKELSDLKGNRRPV